MKKILKMSSVVLLSSLFAGEGAMAEKMQVLTLTCEVVNHLDQHVDKHLPLEPEFAQAIEQGKSIQKIVYKMSVRKVSPEVFENIPSIDDRVVVTDNRGRFVAELNSQSMSQGRLLNGEFGGRLFMTTPEEIDAEFGGGSNVLQVGVATYNDLDNGRRQDTYVLTVSRRRPEANVKQKIVGHFVYHRNLIFDGQGHSAVAHSSRVECNETIK